MRVTGLCFIKFEELATRRLKKCECKVAKALAKGEPISPFLFFSEALPGADLSMGLGNILDVSSLTLPPHFSYLANPLLHLAELVEWPWPVEGYDTAQPEPKSVLAQIW